MYKILFLAVIVFIFAACQNRPLQQLGATSISQKIDKYKLEGGDNVIVDILFVIDNSNSMFEEQEKVAQNIENFMRMLRKSAVEGKTSYHIGITTTSVWDSEQTNDIRIKDEEDGRLIEIKKSCTITQDPNNPNRLLYDSEPLDNRARFLDNSYNDNVVELLRNTIRCIGTNGSNIERGFDAMKKALSPERLSGENRGFLREDAKLMVIVIGDEDDCSTGLRAYDPVTGNPIEDDPSFTNFPISITRSKDCVEQSDLIPAATDGVVKTKEDNRQNKLKPLKEYYDFLVSLKNGDYTKVGFAAIVGPYNCWSGAIDDIGQGPLSGDMSIPFAFQNCSYKSEELPQQMYDANFNTCKDNIPPICDCSDENSENYCDTHTSLYTTCFNNAQGIPNRIPIISDEPCSEAYLNGKCEEGKHCEVTERGVKCVENTCSSENVNGTCPANQYCDNGVCTDKVPATYAQRDSMASPGKRFLQFESLVEQKNIKDSYKYSICLEDFGNPLSLIGARLADSKCEYRLINKTDTPCSVIINIYSPDDKNLEHPMVTSLNSPWTYTTKPEFADKTGEELYRICKENIGKPFSERVKIEDFLEKVPCGVKGDGETECLKILFPKESGECPQPGSNVEIYYGVIE